MHIKRDLDIIADRLTDRLHLADGRPYRPRWFQDITLLGQAPADKLPACGFGLQT